MTFATIVGGLKALNAVMTTNCRVTLRALTLIINNNINFSKRNRWFVGLWNRGIMIYTFLKEE